MSWRALTGVVALTVLLSAPGATPAGGASLQSGVHSADGGQATGAPTAATVVIGQDGKDRGYDTKLVTLAQGGRLSVVNFDTFVHTVTSDATDITGRPLFDVEVAGGGTTASVRGVSDLAAGVYPFHCRFHPGMVGTLVVEGGDGGVQPAKVKFEQPLFIPEERTDSRIKIKMRKADVRVLPYGPRTPMWTYGGTFPGPTIVRPTGRMTRVTFDNQLPKAAHSVSVHYHGDHHKAKHDGQPTRQLIHRGESRTYKYPGTDNGRPQRAASNWYHDHRNMVTGRNVWRGLAGMFITRDARAKELRLPRGRFDVPLMVTDRSFTKENKLKNPFPDHPSMELSGPGAPPADATVGTHILANGRFAPRLKVSTHRYRLRLLNASNFTPYNFQLSNGRPFVQIATGNGLLPKPVVKQTILLGPAQRADVIVDFHKMLDERVVLQTVPRTDTNDAEAIDTPTASIMQFRVVRKADGDKSRIPTRLQKPPGFDPPTKAQQTWRFDVGGNPETGSFWTINGRRFKASRVDYRVPLGDIQTWKLRNTSDVTHFIHLHQQMWRTISRNGLRPPPSERGLEDTWKLDPGETVKVAARFTDYKGVFMLHCHMLDHEDHGLMAQFKVVEPDRMSAAGAEADTARASTASGTGPLPPALRTLFPSELPARPQTRMMLAASSPSGRAIMRPLSRPISLDDPASWCLPGEFARRI